MKILVRVAQYCELLRSVDMAKKKKTIKKQISLKAEKPSLVKELFKDVLIEHWLVALLATLVVFSAMYQAKTSHDTRRAVAESQKLREQQQQLEIDAQSLRLEITSLSEANRISSLAKKQLDMIEVTTKNEKIITL
jgi:cell division protein FtsL